jgi:hypothetical protein
MQALGLVISALLSLSDPRQPARGTDLSQLGIPVRVPVPAAAKLRQVLTYDPRATTVAITMPGHDWNDASLTVTLRPSWTPRRPDADAVEVRRLGKGWSTIVKRGAWFQVDVWQPALELHCTGIANRLTGARQMESICRGIEPSGG